ncbi:mitochondrial glycerol-3-phosphate dehydrogenase [Malassezia pachydermatis]|uniref:Glycerol-3-phosphate dehydrogenase n=1 Tax=Malassezia pachydermatis TaxID=77020 RepID=A0A0M9VN11_9BASI|nr:glycerol-3-phosphate dehydrogenase [Malassezia pachydermatis]KOS12859.1 glycerol-3-phosphate dehydrogenase [Malassezia pachydermatis]
MFRSAVRRLSQKAGVAANINTPRGRAAVLATAAVVSAGTVFALTRKGDWDDFAPSHDVSPAQFWSPPTRSQMIEALKKSSRQGLRDDGSLEQKKSLLLPSHQAVGHSPIPEVEHAYVDRNEDDDEGFDLLIVGGGATGAGCAVDAATRGLKVAIVERDDYGAGTSSKSTKLVHGGVRYLQKAVMQLDYEQYKMVKEALHERKTFLHIAPYLSNPLPILIPAYSWWLIPYYYAGTKLYDMIAGRENMGNSYIVGREKALELFPMLRSHNLAGGVVYYDGQQNDTRMNIALILTAIQHGAVAANHTEVVALNKAPSVNGQPGKIIGARLRDLLTGDEFDVKAKGVVNATGPFCDSLRKMDDPSSPDIVAPSSGAHITFPGYFSPRGMGLLDPATSDGRVIFFLPWQGSTIAGTTDTAAKVEAHPLPGEQEISWILDEVRNYLNADVTVKRTDVMSAWSGLRPLVKDPAARDTQSLVRNHMINVSDSGLLTIAGGKWTTYREMAEETINTAIKAYNLQPLRSCVSKQVRLIGSHSWSHTMYVRLLQEFGLETEVAKHLSDSYGDRAWSVCAIAEHTGKRYPVHGVRLDSQLPYIEAEVRYATRCEYATKAADFIARRSRMSFLNTEATIEALPRIIDIMGEELDWSETRKQTEFQEGILFLSSMGVEPSRVAELAKHSLVEARRWKDLSSPRQVSPAMPNLTSGTPVPPVQTMPAANLPNLPNIPPMP